MEKKLEAEPAILVEEPRRLPPHANCGNCFYAVLEAAPDGQIDITMRTCYRRSPSAFGIPQAVKQMNPTTGRVEIGTAIQFVSLFPPMRVVQRCHDWAPQDKDVEAGVGMIGGKGAAKAN